MIYKYEDFNSLDQGSFKAFIAAARTLNFTLAAEKAAMTQSGVSQHIARLEQQTGTQLFARINKKVSLTKAGEILFKFIENQKERTEAILEEIHGETNKIRGTVRYGMPSSCLFAPHFGILLNKRKDFEEVNLEVSLCPNDAVYKKLLNQQIDFGFVTRKESNPAIHFDFFCQEQYILVGNDKTAIKTATKEDILGSKFVSYPGMNVLFDIWARHNFKRQTITSESLNIAGSIENLHGAITMLKHGVGLTIIPKHCVEEPLQNKSLHEFYGPNRNPLLNDINIVTLDNVELPKRVKTVINVFQQMKKGRV